jgi:hypothetical protein
LAERLQQAARTSNRVLTRYHGHSFYPEAETSLEASVAHWTRMLLLWMIVDYGEELKDAPASSDEAASAKDIAEAHLKASHPLEALRGRDGRDLPNVWLLRVVRAAGRDYWLLLDEMDDDFVNSSQGRFRIAGLLFAAKQLARDLACIRVRITVRPHILALLSTKIDNIQQLHGNEIQLSWRVDELKAILARRILHFEEITGRNQQDWLRPPPLGAKSQTNAVLDRFFEDFDMSFVSGQGRSYKAFHTLALRRPRWMLEFCGLALKEARGDRATVQEYRKAMHIFGGNRIRFLAGEHHAHTPHLETMINDLAGADAMIFSNSMALRSAIYRYVLRRPTPPVRAVKPEEDDALDAARSLYMVEFIRARQRVDQKNYRFITFVEQPRLLSSWNAETSIRWEIHPTFQRALNLVDNQTYAVGPDDIRIFGQIGEDGEAALTEEEDTADERSDVT